MKEPGEKIDFADGKVVQPTKGSAGLKTQLPGRAATVSNLANTPVIKKAVR